MLLAFGRIVTVRKQARVRKERISGSFTETPTDNCVKNASKDGMNILLNLSIIFWQILFLYHFARKHYYWMFLGKNASPWNENPISILNPWFSRKSPHEERCDRMAVNLTQILKPLPHWEKGNKNEISSLSSNAWEMLVHSVAFQSS